jgi:hypothetical protein
MPRRCGRGDRRLPVHAFDRSAGRKRARRFRKRSDAIVAEQLTALMKTLPDTGAKLTLVRPEPELDVAAPEEDNVVELRAVRALTDVGALWARRRASRRR